MIKYTLGVISGIAALAACASAAQSAAVITLRDSGSNVVGVLSGTLDITGLTGVPGYVSNTNGSVFPPNGTLAIESKLAPQTLYALSSGPASFGAGGVADAAGSTGDSVYLYGAGNDLWLPASYVSGAALSGTTTYTGASLSSLGLTPGDYVYTLPTGDTLTLEVGVPEPGTWAVMLIGLGLTGAAMRSRRQVVA